MGFNYFFVNHVVPSIAKNIKARKKTAIVEETDSEKELLNINVTLPDVTLSKVEISDFIK